MRNAFINVYLNIFINNIIIYYLLFNYLFFVILVFNMKKIEKINALVIELQHYINTFRNDTYVACVLKSFEDTLSEYADLYIFSEDSLKQMKKMSLTFDKVLSKEDLDKLNTLPDIVGLSTSFANGYKYGCINENLNTYDASSKKFKYYITGKYSGVSALDLHDFFIFDKAKINTIHPVKSDTYFPINGAVSEFITVKDFLESLFKSVKVEAENKQVEEQTSVPFDKADVFAAELSKIFSNDIKVHVSNLLRQAHDFNFIKPSSSTGKYHPDHDNGEQGLIRHTKAVVRFAQELMRGRPLYDNSGIADLVYAACILHDMDKYNDEYPEYTNPVHPLSMKEKVIKYTDSLDKRVLLSTKESLYKIANYIGSHHGRWNEIRPYADGKTKIIGYLPYPADETAWLVHEADLIASRSFIHINFDDNNDIIG